MSLKRKSEAVNSNPAKKIKSDVSTSEIVGNCINIENAKLLFILNLKKNIPGAKEKRNYSSQYMCKLKTKTQTIIGKKLCRTSMHKIMLLFQK